MRMFLKRPAREREPLAVAMSGVRMGERLLQVGVNDAAIAGALMAKVGLTGHAAIAVATAADGERAQRAAADAGALVDLHVAPLDALPLPDQTFDVVVVHGAEGLLASLEQDARVRVAREFHRVLRQGGRALVIEAEARGGLSRLLRKGAEPAPDYVQSGGATATLSKAGFSAVRLLATREGHTFVEGLKG